MLMTLRWQERGRGRSFLTDSFTSHWKQRTSPALSSHWDGGLGPCMMLCELYYQCLRVQWCYCMAQQINILQDNPKTKGSRNKNVWIWIWTLGQQDVWHRCIRQSAFVLWQVTLNITRFKTDQVSWKDHSCLSWKIIFPPVFLFI